MLQNILPGLRELRAPLAAGYTWLLGLWILLGTTFENQNLTGTVYEQFISLSAWAGRPATLLAISFVAYLIGVLSGALTSLINRESFRILSERKVLRKLVPHHRNEERAHQIIEYTLGARLVRRYETDGGFKARVLAHWRRAVYMSKKYGHKLNESIFTELRDDEVERMMEEDSAFREHVVLQVVDVDDHVPSGRTDAEFIRYRLAGKEDQIYNEFDRTWSEGELRLGMAIPSLFLWIALATDDSPLWLAGIAFSVTIAYVGAKSFSDAQMYLYSTVASGRVPLESFDKLRPDQIRMMPYNRLLADDSPPGRRKPIAISLSENEYLTEIDEDHKTSKDSDAS